MPPNTARVHGSGSYTDLLGGILPLQPGLYVRDDAYHYQGDASRIIFNGNAQLNVDQKYLADLLALT